jgi:hypothetical protein
MGDLLLNLLAGISTGGFVPSLNSRRGFFGEMIGWFIRVVIYDICVTTIQEVFGVSRFTAIFIFLGILLVISFGGYVFKQKMSRGVDEP